jgi:hypothetical protein
MEHAQFEFSGNIGPEVMQQSESIEYRGSIYWLYGSPFDHFLKARKDIYFESYGDNDLKGYQAYWRLEDNKLYLISLEGRGYTFQSIFGHENDVLAEWFSGPMEIGLGEPIHSEGDVTYPHYLWLLIEKGIVIERRIIVHIDSPLPFSFGRYAGFNISEALWGRIDNASDRRTICRDYISDIIGFLTDSGFNKKVIVPFFNVTDNLRLTVNTFRNTEIKYLLTEDFIAIQKQNYYDGSGPDIAEQLSELLQEILMCSFYTSLVLRNPTFPDAVVAPNSLLINPNHSYIQWAIKNVENFSVPPHILSEKINYSRLKKFTLKRLNGTIFEYVPDMETLSFQFSESIQTLNIAKYRKLNRLLYDPQYHIYMVDLIGEELFNSFGYFLDESFTPILEDEEDYEDDNDYDSHSNYDYERDYFDAMTDGQLGDYDEFRENGGDIDGIDTWSRG